MIFIKILVFSLVLKNKKFKLFTTIFEKLGFLTYIKFFKLNNIFRININ